MTVVLKSAKSAVTTRVLEGFDDPYFGPREWEELLESTGCDIVYLTWEYQRAWWEAFGKGDLLLTVAERDGRVIALAPCYARSGMVYFVGNAHWEADRLDFIGEIGGPGVMEAILRRAREEVSSFHGFKFEFVPESSRTGELLKDAAERLKCSCYEEWSEKAVTRDLRGAESPPESCKRENFFLANGLLEVQHLQDGDAIPAHLPAFFEQHIARWAVKQPNRSAFLEPRHRTFYERLTQIAARTGWLRFSRLDWNKKPIAFHYGFCYRGRFFWNASSFDSDLAARSPGQVMLRQLMLAARSENAGLFDFGTGQQAFKMRHATHSDCVKAWGLYPRSRGSNGQAQT